MPRILVALLALVSISGMAYAEAPPAPAAAIHAALLTPAPADNPLLRSLAAPGGSAHSTPVALTCCKVCSVGKACGNTCISRDKTCHVGRGCACDG
jgi:hypothetical protein